MLHASRDATDPIDVLGLLSIFDADDGVARDANTLKVVSHLHPHAKAVQNQNMSRTCTLPLVGLAKEVCGNEGAQNAFTRLW